MGNVDRVDDRAFRVTFTGEGAAKLREAVRDKLKEFMGDYTDDTLVEYVVVLLRNGRRKDEARNELNVFLGDDSDSFVAWLWDHLSSNLNLYLQPQEGYADEVPRKKSVLGDHDGKIEAQHADLEPEKGTLDNLSRGRHKREWKGLGGGEAQVPPLRSSEFEDMHVEEKNHHKVNRAGRSPSPKPQQHKKRSRHEERERTKREPASQASIGAPRRLLQFAVRDAVESLRPSGSVEPSQKRLRSVVSTSSEDSSFVDHPRRLQSIARVPNAMSTVVKAVQEAAEDVRKVKPSVSVFDRLGRDMEVSGTGEQVTQFRDFAIGDEYEEFNAHEELSRLNYIQRSDYGGNVGNINMIESETGMDHDLISENKGFDDVNMMGGRVVDIRQAGASGGMRGEDSILMRHKVAKNSDDSMLVTRIKDQNLSLPTANVSRKIASNVNTLKPPHYQESRDIEEMDNRKSVQENEVDAGKPGVRPMKENSNPVTVGNGNAKLTADVQNDPLKTLPSGPGSHTAGRPLEDADSRTIFVNNVHFAATKDSLSRHFNKFGDVLKVVIVTDATTGQPKGSAYVEFMRKEAADNALSLDGTSFMSRILKVVKRSSANLEATPNMPWPRVAHGSPYSTARFSRAPFPRGLPGGFRPQLSMKPGARSLQWKRDAQGTTAESAPQPVSGNNFFTPTPRSLTYVRTDPKPDRNSGVGCQKWEVICQVVVNIQRNRRRSGHVANILVF